MNIQATEESRLRKQVHLDGLKDAAERNRLGQFSTPPKLALQITDYVQELWKKRNGAIRFLDPGIGTGAFYSALRHVFEANQIQHSVGIEIDPDFASTARSLWHPTDLQVITGDFTKQNPPATDKRFSLILTNPPYVRHHHLSGDDKRRLKASIKATLHLEISGLSGLYVYFLLLSHQWMQEGGLGVWLIPSEFMEVNYGIAVRKYLTHHVRLKHIHRFCPSDVQFCDALVTSTIVVFEKATPSPSHQVRFTFGGSLIQPKLEEHVSLATLRNITKWTLYPHRPENGSRTNPDHVTLGQLFSIKRGLATGSNGFFILPRYAADMAGIPNEAIRPVLPSPRHIPDLVIERNRDGWPAIDKQLALIDCSMHECDIRERYPKFWRYLESGLAHGVHQGYLASRRDPWYSQEHRAPAPFLCTYMGRKKNGSHPFRFYWNKSDATAANVYLLLYPKLHLKEALHNHPEMAALVFEALCKIESDNFIAEGRVYGGGLHKVEPKELAALSGQFIIDLIGDMSLDTQLEFSFASPV